jgi:hypothetical protein
VQPLQGPGKPEGTKRVVRTERADFAVLATVLAVCALVGVGTAFAVPSSTDRQEALRSSALSAEVSSSAALKGAPRLQQIDGGLGYYGRFSNPLPTSASYFPIAVWGAYAHDKANRDKDAAVGINTYVWAADPQYFRDIRVDGRFHVIADEGHRSNSNIGSETAGWLLGDEIDMTEGPGACRGTLASIKAGLPKDGRLRFMNYGKGVAIWQTDAQAACFVNAQDLTSVDMYWHTDPNEDARPQDDTSWGYGWTVERARMLDRMDGKITPQWNFVEVTWPWSEDPAQHGGPITPAQIRGAVWHSLIAGARGIIYFQHSFVEGPCQTHMALRMVGTACYGATIDMVRSTNRRIKSLARVLNAPFVTSHHSARDRMVGKVRYMVKWSKGKFWVFAGAGRSGGKATFTIRCIGNATAKVLFENRSIPVRRGSFTDSFADGDAIHIYRIDGGSSCRLK